MNDLYKQSFLPPAKPFYVQIYKTMENNTHKKIDKTEIKTFIDFQFKSITEASNAAIKGLPLYFTVIIAICAYFLLNTEISIDIKRFIICFILITSIVVLVAFWILIKGIISGYNDLKLSFYNMDANLYNSTNMEMFITRGQKIIKIVRIGLVITILSICIGSLLFLKCL